MNGDGGLLVQFLLALGAVLFLIVVIAWLLKKVNLVSSRVGRLGEDARLSVSEAVAVDHRRKLVLVKRDHVEHLILIGGENDLLLEHAIPPHARPQPKTPPQPQHQQAQAQAQAQQAPIKPAQEAAKDKAGQAPTTSAVAANPQKASKAPAVSPEMPASKSATAPKAEKLTAPVSAAISALSPKSGKADKTATEPRKQTGQSEAAKSSNGQKNEVGKAPLSPQATIADQKPASQETAQSDVMANWRPARPLARPTQAPVQDTPQSPKGPMVPPPVSVQAPASQPTPSEPAATAQAPQPQQPAPQAEPVETKSEDAASNDATHGKSKQQKPDDQQTLETNYQDEITRLLDELSSDSNKS